MDGRQQAHDWRWQNSGPEAGNEGEVKFARQVIPQAKQPDRGFLPCSILQVSCDKVSSFSSTMSCRSLDGSCSELASLKSIGSFDKTRAGAMCYRSLQNFRKILSAIQLRSGSQMYRPGNEQGVMAFCC